MQDVVDSIIIGGGQAGLAMGHALQACGEDFRILEAAAAVGQTWHDRYDSLVLFTPTQYSALPGLPFPQPADTYPTKANVVAYLEQYVAAFALPVQLNTRVTAVRSHAAGFRVETTQGTYQTRAVIIATGPFQEPWTPAFAAMVAPHVIQLHSATYQNPNQLPAGPTLVVGAGNSGAQIAAELAQTHHVTLTVGKRPPQLPQRLLGRDIFWWLHQFGIMRVTRDTRLGQRMRRLDPLIGSNLRQLVRAHGICVVGRALGADGAMIQFADGSAGSFASIIWATGYRPAYPWLHVPVLDANSRPVHQRGISHVPGVYFIGLPWQYRRGSALLGGVGEDAAFLAPQITHYLRKERVVNYSIHTH